MVEHSEMLKEEMKLGVLQSMVDKVCGDIIDGRLTREEAQRLAGNVREKAQLLIPDMMDTYDLIYGSRFRRLIEQFLAGEDE
jgi:hypothetical protein